MIIEDTSDRGTYIEHRIDELRVKARTLKLNGDAEAHVSWPDFAEMVRRMCARVSEVEDDVYTTIYTAGGSVLVRPDFEIEAGAIVMDVAATSKWSKPAGLDSGQAIKGPDGRPAGLDKESA